MAMCGCGHMKQSWDAQSDQKILNNEIMADRKISLAVSVFQSKCKEVNRGDFLEKNRKRRGDSKHRQVGSDFQVDSKYDFCWQKN